MARKIEVTLSWLFGVVCIVSFKPLREKLVSEIVGSRVLLMPRSLQFLRICLKDGGRLRHRRNIFWPCNFGIYTVRGRYGIGPGDSAVGPEVR